MSQDDIFKDPTGGNTTGSGRRTGAGAAGGTGAAGSAGGTGGQGSSSGQASSSSGQGSSPSGQGFSSGQGSSSSGQGSSGQGSSSFGQGSSGQGSSSFGQAGEAASQAYDEASQGARTLMDQARDWAISYAETGKASLADQLDQLVTVVRHAGQSMQSGEQPIPAAHYVTEAATQLQHLSMTVRERSTEDLFRTVTRFAYRNRTAIFSGAVLAGVALGRFAIASGQNRNANMRSGTGSGGEEFGAGRYRVPGRTGDVSDRYRTGGIAGGMAGGTTGETGTISGGLGRAGGGSGTGGTGAAGRGTGVSGGTTGGSGGSGSGSGTGGGGLGTGSGGLGSV